MKTLLIVVASVVGITVTAEAGLRWFVGLGNPLLYVPDEEVGYLVAPNQEVRRGKNKIIVNQYSMRSESVNPDKSGDTIRVFVLGDTVVNGGWWTDQSAILSQLLKTELQQNPQFSQRSLEVLNASAKSWNPRNELAYIKKYGLFAADTLVLAINTEDLFGTEPSSVVVGRDRHYPTEKPALALFELYQRYLPKQPPIPELRATESESKESDRVDFNLDAIKQIQAIAKKNDTRLILVMTPLLQELRSGSNQEEIKARTRLQMLAARENITYIDFLPIFTDFPQPEFLYRDRIHLSPQGETLVSKKIAQTMLD